MYATELLLCCCVVNTPTSSNFYISDQTKPCSLTTCPLLPWNRIMSRLDMKRFPRRPSFSSWQLGHRGQFRLWLWSSPTSPRAPHPPGVRGQKSERKRSAQLLDLIKDTRTFDWKSRNNTRRKRTGANGLGNQEDDKHYIYVQLETKSSFKIKQEVSKIQTHGERQ